MTNDRRMSAFPRKRTKSRHRGMSALCQKRTFALQQTVVLLDYLVGERKQFRRNFEPVRNAEAALLHFG